MALMRVLQRFFFVFGVPNILIFAPLVLLTRESELVTILNIALVSMGFGVCTAYLPAVIRIMIFDPIASKVMTGGDFLSMGVFGGWFAMIITRSFSLTFFARGMPTAMLASDLFSYCLFMALCSAFFHLRAPAAVEGHVPSKTFVYFGVAVAVLAFVVICYAYATSAIARPA